MTIFLYAVGSALLFALAFLFRKQALTFIPFQLALVTEVLTELAITLLIFLLIFWRVKKTELSFNGITLAILAGLIVTFGVVLNYLALRSGFLSKIIAITSPSQIIFGIVIGYFLLKESLTPIQTIGIVLCLVGIYLVTR